MNNLKEHDPRIADELCKYRLAPPSLDLQDHVLRAARQAMEAGEAANDHISWKFPVFRFAVCLLISVLLIFAGKRTGDNVISQWKYSPASFDRLTSDTASIAGLADAPFIVKLAASDPGRLQSIAREQFLNYQTQVQELSSSNQ